MLYSKFESSIDQATDKQARSTIWCVNRLRRLIYAAKTESTESLKDMQIVANEQWTVQQINHVTAMIDLRLQKGTLNVQTLRCLIDRSMMFVREANATELIEKLVTGGVQLLDGIKNEFYGKARIEGEIDENQAMYLDIKTLSPFSDRFERCLLQRHHDESSNGLWKKYMNWPLSVQTNVMTIELVAFLKEFAASSTWSSSEQLQHLMKERKLIQGFLKEPVVFYKSFRQIAQWLISIGDWRILRVWYNAFRLVQVELHKKLDDTEKTLIYKYFPSTLSKAMSLLYGMEIEDRDTAEICQETETALNSYIYGGSCQSVDARRNEAWLAALLFPDFVKKCTFFLVQWCLSQDKWVYDMDHILSYLGWLICPSEDRRTAEAIADFESWLQALKSCQNRDSKELIRLFSSTWRDVFNGNVIVAVCMIYALLTLLPWNDDDLISMIDGMAINPNTTLTVTYCSAQRDPYDRNVLYFLMDTCMNQHNHCIESNTALTKIIEHVNNLINNH
ncbi:hypothetical protein EC973_009090 [Apophysomyces ossiformis]|uniref:Uncharacterized protein n=1 Tax=Apophysomyces ossiformis TaxID=679940 RepID=A0A8H7ENN0_9FUNG|nr:hypothetical protein EC973_009090 [Apophysomyces ossiformis]